MKGLIIKEFYLSRKLRIIGLLLYLLLLIFAVLVKLSILYGNLGHLNEGAQKGAENAVFNLMAFGLPLVLYASQFNCQIASDEKAHFRTYSFTLPVTERQTVSSVYVLNLIMLGAVTVISWLNYGLACLVYDRTFEPMYLIYILGIGGIIFTFSHGRYTLFYRFRNEKKANTFFTVICMAIYIGADFGIMGWINSYIEKQGYSIGDDLPNEVMEGFWDEELKRPLQWIDNNGWWVIILAIVGLSVLFWYLSVRALKRRGN